MDFKLDVTKYIYRHLEKCKREGRTPIALQGSRRSSKTWTVCQFLIMQILTEGDKCVVASMTDDQGRLGAYTDFQNILDSMPKGLRQYFEVSKSPREIRCRTTPRGRHGVVHFKSFPDERAKGVSCDWVFINEANNFTEQQYNDLAANARKGVILDYNPQNEFWVDDLPDIAILRCTWQKNAKHLTPAQIKWFEDLKKKAERPNATGMDKYLYSVYYLGEYSDVIGDIFTPDVITMCENIPDGLYAYRAFADPSDLRGADYFAMCLGATDGEKMYVLDTFSINEGSFDFALDKLREWGRRYKLEYTFVERNGSIGQKFYEYATNSGLKVHDWWSRGNKFDRITANYQNITQRVEFAKTRQNDAYLTQVYTFGKKCEHDDNVDAINSLLQSYIWDGKIVPCEKK